MSYNSFDYYRQLRQYQLHINKLANPQTNVPTHQAFKPNLPHIDKKKEWQRQKKLMAIERENEVIMHKLVQINRRKPQISRSVPSLTLPPLRRQKSIPLYQQQNNKIAKKIIGTRSSIDNVGCLQRYRSVQARKKSISKYVSQEGMMINRKKYLAQLMLLKKMRVSEVINK